jgi:5-methylcytosine-specific restriction endonuclease McrA
LPPGRRGRQRSFLLPGSHQPAEDTLGQCAGIEVMRDGRPRRAQGQAEAGRGRGPGRSLAWYMSAQTTPSWPVSHLLITVHLSRLLPCKRLNMRFTEGDLEAIYGRTTGYCHICHRKVCFTNYGRLGARGAWEVEHSRAKVHGGTNRLSNLYPACILCNRSKGAYDTRTARRRAGTVRAPLSRTKRERVKQEAAVATGLAGALLGAAFLGPLGAWIGGGLGVRFGYHANPDR